MTPERFREVERLAMLALDCEGSARAEFLQTACAGDGDLRREVESLLAADENAREFLVEPAVHLIAAAPTDASGPSGNRTGDGALAPGAAVGRYRLERELGRGGMGLVHAAYDPELDRRVAIKLVRPTSSGNADQSRTRLLREAQAMAQLTHPNVVAIHDVGTFADQVFIAMEYAEGSTLSDWLRAHRRSWRDVVAMFAQAGRGLAAAHAKKIVHRDFKADNVWVGQDGRARVLDFGLARAMRVAGEEPPWPGSPARALPGRAPLLSAAVTRPGTLLGTPPYMSPEQLKGAPGDARSDQFSFCVALYSALYGELPFRGETVAALLEQIERRRIPEPPASSQVPASLRRALLRGLSADPAGRFDSMEELLAELTRPPRSRRLLLAPVAAALAASAVAGWHGAVHVGSVAVLPLKNLSGDPRQDHLADGMTEELITELGKISALQVLSYQSTARYRQSVLPLALIARELKVDAFLEGAILRSGGKVRITAKLVQAAPERQLWAQSWEFEPQDIVATQAEVARAVATGIRVTVKPSELSRLTSARRVSSDAYDAYLLGRAELAKPPTPASWAAAKAHFEKAIEKDPAYAPAHAGMAELYIRHRPWQPGHVDARREARRWGEKAIALDDSLADAHTILARCAQQDWDWAGTEREFRRALELNPSHALARTWYTMYLFAMRRFDEAVSQANRAQQLDPLSPLVNTWAGYAEFLAGRVEEGVATLRKVLEADPRHSDASLALARAELAQGKFDDAIVELRKALLFNPKQPLLLGALAQAHARAGQREEAQRLVAELKRIEADSPGYGPFGAIWAYEGLGDKDAAFAYLEKAYRERAGRLVWLDVDPTLDSLRSDPRFTDLLRRIGLTASNGARLTGAGSPN